MTVYVCTAAVRSLAVALLKQYKKHATIWIISLVCMGKCPFGLFQSLLRPVGNTEVASLEQSFRGNLKGSDYSFKHDLNFCI